MTASSSFSNCSIPTVAARSATASWCCVPKLWEGGFMRIYRIASAAVVGAVVFTAFVGAASAADTAVPGWDPAAFRDASVIQIMTTEPDVGKHWSKLWVVVID